MQDYEMFSLKVPTPRADKLDKLIQLTHTGMVPGHDYKDRSAFMREAMSKLEKEVLEALADTKQIASAIERLIADVQGGLEDGTSGD